MPASQAPKLAYLVSVYPAISHTFILRELRELRALGHDIVTASINRADRPTATMEFDERQEADATYCVKADGARGAFRALGHWMRHAPVRLAATFATGLSLRGGRRWWLGLAYAVEAAMVARWMRRERTAHLHVHFGSAAASVGVLVKRLTGCHLSLTIHGPDEFDDVPGQHLALKMREADAVVCISQFARAQLMRVSDPACWPKLRVCRLGVAPSQFPFVSREGTGITRLLCVGRLAPAKGQMLLVEACARLRDAGLPFDLTLVGDGPDRVRVERAIAANRLADRVRLTGALDQTGVRAEFAQADIFVLPSLAEGIPVVLMEAMASGVPCVTTPVNGIPELVENGRTGLLARPGDVDSLVEALRRLIDDRELRRALALAAREKVSTDFDLARNVEALGRIFRGFGITDAAWPNDVCPPAGFGAADEAGQRDQSTPAPRHGLPVGSVVACDLSVLIVTYNSARLIGPLLSQLRQDLAGLAAEVIVVDNASVDGTAALIRDQHPWVTLVANPVNLGFAAGNNCAAKRARGRHLLLLNPDAVPEVGALARGVDLMDRHPEVGLAGGELRGADGSRQPSARMFPTLRDELFTLSGLAARHPGSRLFARLDRRWADPEQPAEVDWIPGAFVFIRTRDFVALDGFDERFFMYYEEVDLCRRLVAAGRKVQYWPQLKATHIGGESARTVRAARVSRTGSQLESWRMRSGLLYYRKHHGAAAAAGLHAIERTWHRMRDWKARWYGQHEKSADFGIHCAQLVDAWRDTAGGTRSPRRPW